MGWSVGYDDTWHRDVGYGVIAFCDEPGCEKVIDRGLAYVCTESKPYGGENGCGLYFCEAHRGAECTHEGYTARLDHPAWINHKLTDPTWGKWREANPDSVAEISKIISTK